MNVTDPRRDLKGGPSEDWDDTKVFRPVLNEHLAARQRIGQRLVDNEFRRWLVLDGDQRARTAYVASAGCCNCLTCRIGDRRDLP